MQQNKLIMTNKNHPTRSPIPILFFLVLAIGSLIIYHSNKTMFVSPAPQVNQLKGSFIPDFPAFPIYPNAKAESTQKTNAYGSQPVSFQATLESDDDVSAIVDWYKNELPRSGWSIELDGNGSAVDQTLFARNGNSVATIYIEHETDETEILVHVQ
jgi:hypothetical protein